MRLMRRGSFCLLLTAFMAGSAYGGKTNQAVYEEPFDLAAGGSSLTRASREGVLFANPAIMPYGEKFFRWLGMQTSVIAARESVSFAKSLAGGGQGDAQGEEIIDKVLVEKTPLHFGMTNALSFISNNFGVGAFARLEPDIYGEQFGVGGTPAIHVTAEAYSGAVASLAYRPLSWLSLGVTGKYLYVAEPDIELALSDQARIQELANNPQSLQEAASFGSGFGTDVGLLVFLQGYSVDWRFALKVDDLGDTNFTGSQKPFLQAVHTGAAVTFHGAQNALHLSLDYRDALNAYEEKTFKKIYAGAKLMLFEHLGLAAGLYQGIPTVGVRLEAFFLKLGATAYGREMGDAVGQRQRNLYVAYFSAGF